MSVIESNADVDARVGEIASVAFWRTHFPELSINDRLASWNRDVGALPDATREVHQARMLEEGYFQDRNETCERLAGKLAGAIGTCKQLNIPPAFIFLFDETWEVFYALHPVLAPFLGAGYKILPDFWAWHVDPKVGEAGWRPHRDKGRAALSSFRTPTSLTVWIPLTEATPQNGCMYLLPANRDPVYATADEQQWKIDLAAIRALPARPGEFLCWNQAVLHWGSMTSRFAPHPRMSMALEFQRADIPAWNTPLLEPFGNLSFASRLRLVGKQILQYKHMYPLAPRFQALAEKLVQ